MKRKINKILTLLTWAAMVSTTGCIEEIDITTDVNFEDVIVIEATLTNEVKNHVIKVTRSFRFEETDPRPETGASVEVVANESTTYTFIEDQSGLYVSTSAFAAEPNVDYRLFVTTQAGRSYTTPNVQLSAVTDIDDLYVEREFNSVGTEVLTINVDSFDPSRSSNYYRYEYEETYKIIAPDWRPQDFVILQDEDGNDLPAPGFEPRSTDEIVCFKTDDSNRIIQTSTTNLEEDRVSKYPVRTIGTDNPIISHRYSILVRQFVQSLEAYTYYNVLDQLSGSGGNALAQIQPGFIASNIIATEDRNEKVLGFFQVSSVTEKRIFFNYDDLFPGEPLPPYFVECRPLATPQITTPGFPPRTPLKDLIEADLVVYFDDNDPPGPTEGPYFTVPTPCGDCTAIGSIEVPPFWEE